ncbi:MAG: TIGR02117 family protein [Edaphocola sp.]
MKKKSLLIGKVFLYLLSALLLYVAAGWLIPFIPVNRNVTYKRPNEVTIYIKTNGVHTDLAVPVKTGLMNWNDLIKYQDTDLKDTTYRYVGIGWGDKGFYLQTPQWSDLKFSVAFKAMTGLGSSAIHATFYKNLLENESTKAINISNKDYLLLIDYIRSSFVLDSTGNSINILSQNDGYGNMDAFYEAKGSYSLFHTCNTWANGGLKAAKQKAALWTLLPGGIFRHYQ